MTAPGSRLFIDVMGAFVLLALAGFEPFVAQLDEGRWRLSEDLSFVFKRGRAHFVSAGGRASELGRARSKSVSAQPPMRKSTPFSVEFLYPHPTKRVPT